MMNDLARAMRRWTGKKHHNLNHVLAVVTPLSRPRGEVGILFFPSPLPFGGSTVLSLTRGPAGGEVGIAALLCR